jgi:glutathione synthase/RimK-type ligase-like ATP-grasp enzyme
VFQEVIRKKFDITLYVIGDYVWAAAVTPSLNGNDDGDNLDYRRNGLWSQEYTPIVLPPQVERACVQLTRQQGLRMCNIDLILTPEGEYVFLDANPTDLWVGIEHLVGFPLCAALVDVLSGTHTLADHPYLRDCSPVFRPSAYSGLIPKETLA